MWKDVLVDPWVGDGSGNILAAILQEEQSVRLQDTSNHLVEASVVLASNMFHHSDANDLVELLRKFFGNIPVVHIHNLDIWIRNVSPRVLHLPLRQIDPNHLATVIVSHPFG